MKCAAPRRALTVGEQLGRLTPEQLAELNARAVRSIDAAAARVTREQTVGRLHSLFGAPTGAPR